MLTILVSTSSQWVGGHRGRVRVTEGVRLKVRQVSSAAGKKKKKLKGLCERASIRSGEVNSLASTSSLAGFKLEMMALP